MKRGTLHAFILFVMVMASIFSFPTTSYGCSCMKPPAPNEALNNADRVFTGTVTLIQVDPITTKKNIQFSVTQNFKGSGKTVEVKTKANSASCGFLFETGKEYLVYADENGSKYETNLCMRTTEVSLASKELMILNELVPKANNIHDSPERKGSIIPIIAILFILAFLGFIFYFFKRKSTEP